MTDYQLVSQGMLDSRLTLNNIFDLHSMDTRPLSTELYHQKAKIQVIDFVQLNSIKDMKQAKTKNHRHGASGFCCISLLPNRPPIKSVTLIVRGLFA